MIRGAARLARVASTAAPVRVRVAAAPCVRAFSAVDYGSSAGLQPGQEGVQNNAQHDQHKKQGGGQPKEKVEKIKADPSGPSGTELGELRCIIESVSSAEEAEDALHAVEIFQKSAGRGRAEEISRDMVGELLRVCSRYNRAEKALELLASSKKIDGGLVDPDAYGELIEHVDQPDNKSGAPNVERAWVVAKEKGIHLTPETYTRLLKRLLDAERYIMANAVGTAASQEDKLQEGARHMLARAEQEFLKMTYTTSIGTEVEPVPGEEPPPLSYLPPEQDEHTGSHASTGDKCPPVPSGQP